MSHKIIEHYLDEILSPYLTKIGTSDEFIETVSATVRNQMLSCIMEYIFNHNGVFVTSNYFITNDYIEQRKKKVRAGHDHHSMLQNWTNTDGLEDNHKHALEWASDGLKCAF
jgi:hypothetical protein